MDELKRRLTDIPTLVSLDFSPSTRMVILNIDPVQQLVGGQFSHNYKPTRAVYQHDLNMEYDGAKI